MPDFEMVIIEVVAYYHILKNGLKHEVRIYTCEISWVSTYKFKYLCACKCIDISEGTVPLFIQ